MGSVGYIKYNFKVSTISRSVGSFKELLNFVVYDYDVIDIEGIEDKKRFTKQEVDIIEGIIRYQKGIRADMEIVRFIDSVVSLEDITYDRLYNLLKRKERVNRGIYYLPTLDKYTSTTVNNKIREKRRKKEEYKDYITDAVSVVIRTIEEGERVSIRFRYPFKENKELKSVRELDKLYKEIERIIREGKVFRLYSPLIYYTKDTIKEIERVIKEIEDKIKDENP